MKERRELITAIALCLLGAGVVLLAVSRAWVSTRVPVAAPLPPRVIRETGTHFAAGSGALALVGLAGVAALPATRSWGRVLVGVLVAAAGLGIAVVIVRALKPGLGAWPYVALVGAVALVAAGGLVVVRGRTWASMSARYDAPSAPATQPSERSLWEAFDRGEDPTRTHAEGGG